MRRLAKPSWYQVVGLLVIAGIILFEGNPGPWRFALSGLLAAFVLTIAIAKLRGRGRVLGEQQPRLTGVERNAMESQVAGVWGAVPSENDHEHCYQRQGADSIENLAPRRVIPA